MMSGMEETKDDFNAKEQERRSREQTAFEDSDGEDEIRQNERIAKQLNKQRRNRSKAKRKENEGKRVKN